MSCFAHENAVRKTLQDFQNNLALWPADDRQLFKAAYRLADEQHRGQSKFGLGPSYPYIAHPVSVFNYLADRLGRRDRDLLIAALLHDTVEDGSLTFQKLAAEFGERVRAIVMTVTRRPDGPESEEDKRRNKSRFFREVVCRGSDEAKLLGVADKLDNLQRALLIPTDHPQRRKFRRWLTEAEAFLPLADGLDGRAAADMRQAMFELRDAADRDLADRLRGGDQPTLVLVCGMPGTRKSSTAVRLGANLGFASVVGLDEVRDVMRLRDDRPVIHGKSHDCWRLFGPTCTPRTFRLGFMSHCRALRQGALAVIGKNVGQGENTVLEGVHLLPSLYRHVAGARLIHVLLTVEAAIGSDDKQELLDRHQALLAKKFDRRHGRQQPWDEAKVRHLEQIQDILIRDAARCGIPTVASSTPEANRDRILEIIDRLAD